MKAKAGDGLRLTKGVKDSREMQGIFRTCREHVMKCLYGLFDRETVSTTTEHQWGLLPEPCGPPGHFEEGPAGGWWALSCHNHPRKFSQAADEE